MTEPLKPPDRATVSLEQIARPSSAALLRAAGLLYGTIAVGALIWLHFRQRLPVFFGVTFGSQLPRSLLLGFAVGTGVAILSLASSEWTGTGRRLSKSFREILGRQSLRTVLALALLSAVGEELLFRAAIQPHLKLVGTSLLFGALHMPWRRDMWIWPLAAVGAGFLLGWIQEETHCVLGPILAHLIINAVGLWDICVRARPAGQKA